MTEHRCNASKTWRPGKARDCKDCNPPKKQTHGIGGDLPGRHADRWERSS